MAEGSKVDKVDFMEQLLKTGIRGEEWPKVTYLIVYIKNKDGKVIYNNYFDSKDHTHAEIKMLKDDGFLKSVKTGKVDIILTSNYSACSDCASKLVKFHSKHRRSIESFTERCSFLYYIDKKNNQVGLKKLNEAGITLEAMIRESWFDVLTRFMFGLEPDKVRKRDGDTRDGLEKLLSVDKDLVDKFVDLRVKSD